MVRKRRVEASRPPEPEPEPEPVPARVLDANQVVAYNFRAARELRGWTQDECARNLAPHLGQILPKASISSIERSTEGGRIRVFDAHELVAFALTFDLPIVWFLLPPPAAREYQLAGTGRDLSLLIRLLFGRTHQLDVITERMAAIRTHSGGDATGTVVADAYDFPPEVSWEHFARTREEALLALADAESNEIERLLADLSRVMARFEKFSMKTFMATHPKEVYRNISHSLVGERVFSRVIAQLEREDYGRYDRVIAAMESSTALEAAFDFDDAELVQRLAAVFDRVEENLGGRGSRRRPKDPSA
ncbi:MAG: hypothetical protein ACRDRT_04370 [Pseudonocardiaceae bacterium]